MIFPSKISFRVFLFYMTVMAVLSAVSIFLPGFVYIGLYAGILPGLWLLSAVPVFVYSLLAVGLAALLNSASLSRPLSWFLSLTVVMTVSCALALINNSFVEDKVQGMMEYDVLLPAPVRPERIAILTSPASYAGDKMPYSCTDLCLALLKSGKASVVAVGSHSEMDAVNGGENSLRILKRSKYGNVQKKMPVENMLDAFELCGDDCIRPVKAPLNEMEYILTVYRGINNREEKGAAIIKAHRTELFKRTGKRWHWVDRKTYVQAKKMSVPIWAGIADMYGSSHGIRIARKDVFYNLGRYEGWSSYSAAEYKRMFDVDIVRKREVATENRAAYQALSMALNSVSGGDETVDGINVLFKQYLIETQMRQLSGKDADLIIAALSDMRITSGFRDLGRYGYLNSSAFSGKPIVRVIIDRIQSSPLPEQQETVMLLALIAGNLKEANFKDHADDLQKISGDPQRRAAAWRLLTRWADMGQDGYAPLLRLLHAAKEKGIAADNGRAGFAALSGLCLLAQTGIDAPGYKDEIFSYLNAINGRSTEHNMTYVIAARAILADGKPGPDWRSLDGDAHKISFLKNAEREASASIGRPWFCHSITLDK
jgi:hypothetical protein